MLTSSFNASPWRSVSPIIGRPLENGFTASGASG
jgi:hypothetical protein